jgi:hypothetical protein
MAQPCGRGDGRLPPALIREGDEAARSRPLWQSYARKRNAADLLGVNLASADRRHNEQRFG